MTEPQGQAPEGGQQPQNEGGQQPAAAQQQNAQQAAVEAQDVSQLPDWAQKIITEARGEAAKYRTERTAATEQASAESEKLTKVLAALGLNADGEEQVDVETLQAQREEDQTELWSARIELQTLKAAAKHGVKAEALTDSVKFWESMGDIDPADPEFAGKVDAAIAAAVKANPGLKAPQGAPRSGADFTGSPGSAPNIDQQIAEATKNRDFARAIALKRARAAAGQ